MGSKNDASREVCGAKGVTVVRPATTGLSFRPEHHASRGTAPTREREKEKKARGQLVSTILD